ncbi:hypothetical protein ACHAXN_003416 [Cyclotella atomus]
MIMAPAEKKHKKKNKSKHASKDSVRKTPAVRPSTSNTPKRTPETHKRALDLSHQLRQLSNQKRLRECLSLYHSFENDDIRDSHHGSIIIDCCARCGDLDEAERVVVTMLGNTSACIDKDEYIWDRYDHIPYKKMPIQAWTALLKGYVHGGMMAKADSLFCALCGCKAEDDGNEGHSMKKKRVETKQQDKANVRTLNTLLRGCLWSATTIDYDANNLGTQPKQKRAKSRQELVGGIVTAERAWEQFSSMKSDNTCVDSSSYEYFITLLCQSLQCEKAEHQLMQMKEQFKLSKDLTNADPALIESLVVCLVVLSRAYALLGKTNDVKRCANEALKVIRHIESTNSDSKAIPAKKRPNVATGGKQAWKTDANNDGNGRREQSNTLFRSHRISELKAEATSLNQYFDRNSDRKTLAKMMVARLLYFSGGGTTGLNAMSDANSATGKTSPESEQTMLQRYTSLWFSFGLKPAAEMLKLAGLDKSYCTALSQDMCTRLHNDLLGKDHPVITSNGYVDFNTVFPTSADSSSTPLHIELGSGSGDWAVIQAESNPSENYVTVELRSDRVAQTFAKMVLHNPENFSPNKSSVLNNLCCVGSECGSFLSERIQPKTVRTIFVNHPEPPTQTSTCDDNEQAHMLNSKTILAAAKCLEPNGYGRIVIVTDNLIYAKLVGHTAAKILDQSQLIGLKPNEVSDLRKVDTASDPNKHGAFVHIYEGKPSTSIGHYTPKSSNAGTSYFDRLWRTGVGKHADMKKRYIIALRTIGDQFYSGTTSSKATQSSKKTATATAGEKGKGKHSNKRSAEKQQRRNERRLLKKQQQQQQQEKQNHSQKR